MSQKPKGRRQKTDQQGQGRTTDDTRSQNTADWFTFTTVKIILIKYLFYMPTEM